MSFPNSTETNSYPPFQFRLKTTAYNEVLKVPPAQWAETATEMKRRFDAGGVFAQLNINELTFIGRGAKILTEAFGSDGINAFAELSIYRMKTDKVAKTRGYVQIGTTLSFDFKTFGSAKFGDANMGVTISVLKGGILEKFDNRKNAKIDITKNISVGGFEIEPYSDLAKETNIASISSITSATWSDKIIGLTPIARESNDSYTQMPLAIYKSDLNLAMSNEYRTGINNITDVDDFIAAGTEDRDFLFSYYVRFQCYSETNNNHYFLQLITIEGGSVVNENTLASFGGRTDIWTNNFYRTYDETINITLTAGQSLKFVVKGGERSITSRDTTVSFIDGLIYANHSIGGTPATTIESMPGYETFESLLQRMLDVQYPLYSEYLGRKDVKYTNSDYYTTENQESFCSFMTGLNLRGAVLADIDNPLAIKFKELWQTAQSAHNLGYGVETIEGAQRIRIEPYSYFFQDVEVLDLSDRLDRLDISSKVNSEYCYLELFSGYKDYTYESFNGRAEYNTDCSFTTTLNADEEFNNKIPYHGDTLSFVKQIGKKITETANEDVEFDSDIFMLKTQRDGLDWKSETDENVTIENDSSIFKSGSLNLYFTPIRNLIRSSERWSIGLIKSLSQAVKFQVSGKLQTLETTGEGYTIKENADIVPAMDYIKKKFTFIEYEVTCRFDWDDMETLEANPYGYIKLSDTISIWILDIKKENAKDEATIKGIGRYVN